MATRTITTRLALAGESEYRAAIKNINAELALHKSELEKVEVQYSSSANSLEALQARGTVLENILATLDAKYNEQKTMLEKAEQAQRLYSYQVEQSQQKLEKAKVKLEELKGSSDDTSKIQAKLTAEIKKHEEALDEAKKNLQRATNSITDYQKQLNYTARDQANLNTELQNTEKYMEEARQSADNCATSIDQYGQSTKGAKDAVDALAAALAAAGVTKSVEEIAQALWDCIEASVGFESAITGVYKTVNGTPEQLRAIADGIKVMTTTIPATKEEIAAVAEAAGQLGIATEDILSFSRTMLDLGESTNMTADTAATDMARIANITKTAGDGYSRMGSTVVALGNSAATTESEIMAMTTRLASSGTLAGLTVPEIMALATAMSSVGIEAEAGGTAMTQTLTAIEQAVVSGGKELEQYAQIAGTSATEFSTMWTDAPVTAIQAFISGLGRLDEQGESATLVLDELGLSGIRQSNMLKSLALASDTLAGSVSLANQAWAENTALTEEASKRYETTESKLAMMGNAADNVKVAVGDALTPSLNHLAEAGTAAFSIAEAFIDADPWLVQTITGLTAGVTVLTVGVTGYTVASNLAGKATAAFNLALDNCPAIAVASAITALVVAVGAFAADVMQASEENRDFLNSLEASQKAFAETTNSIRQGAEDTRSMLSALENLAAVEVKSTAQKQAMADMVAQLNQAVPELSLAYDELNDSLSMTAEDIRAVAQAQAEQQLRDAEISRLTELYVEQAQIVTDLAAAEVQLAEAQASANAMREAGTYGTMGYEAATQAADEAILSAKKSTNELTKALDDNLTAGRALDPEYEILERNVENAGAAIEDTEETAKTVAEQIAELTSGLEDLSDETQSLVSEMDTLTGALQEQQEAGSLSLNTALDLIDAGYAAALSINEETGAVTLNKDAYIAIAAAKLDEQIASLQTQQTSVQTAIQLKQEAMAVLTDAWAYAELKAARDELEGLEGQSKTYQAQIAALQKLKDSLGNVTVATKATVSASQQAQTQAQKDLAAYQELRAALDHEKAMDLVSEREYYARLKEYRDQYLTDADNLSTYRQITEQIYSYDKSLVDAEAALWEKATETLAGELEERVASIRDAEDKMAQSLRDYGDLFTMEDDKMSLGSLQEQIDAINAYEEALTSLNEKGISESLMDEVLGMDVDEATQYAQQLISMTEEQWGEYNALWEEKQRRAIEVAQTFYQDQLDALQTEYDDKLGEALSELTDTAYASGVETAQGLIDGLAAKESALYAKARAMAAKVSSILSEAQAAYKGVDVDVDGSHAAGLAYVPYDGYIAELHQGERVLTAEEARNYIARSMPRSYEPPRESSTQQVLGSMLSQTVNAMAALNSGQGGQVPEEIVLKLQSDDGTTLGRWMVPFIRAEDKSNPEVVSDKL